MADLTTLYDCASILEKDFNAFIPTREIESTISKLHDLLENESLKMCQAQTERELELALLRYNATHNHRLVLRRVAQ